VGAIASAHHAAQDGGASSAVPEFRSLPLHERHRALGARFVHVDGWELPGWYEDPLTEHRAARHAAGLSDASHQGLVVLRGPDRRAVLDGLVSNDVLHLDRFHGIAACLLTPAGTVVTDLSVYNRGGDLVCVLRPEGTGPFVQTLHANLGLTSTSMEPMEDGSLFFLTGPLHRQVLATVLGSAATPPEGGCLEFAWAGHSLLILSYPPAAPRDHLVRVSASGAHAFFDALLHAGRPLGLRMVGREAQEILRVEAGRPLMDVDMDRSSYPADVNLGHTLSEQKGYYLGRDGLARALMSGSALRPMVGLRTVRTCTVGDTVLCDDHPVGTVTSAVSSPCLDAALALARMRVPPDPGDRLQVRSREWLQEATVVQLPVAS
jgi:aminomethyltransferase